MRKRRVVFAPEAKADIFALYEWVAAQTGSSAARDWTERVEAYCAGFDLASERGRSRDDIRPGMRVTGFERRLTIAFTVSASEVTILRIFGRGMNWDAESEDGLL